MPHLPYLLRRRFLSLASLLLVLAFCGCTSLREYVQNGLKVGPNYCAPSAPVAQNWIDSGDSHVQSRYEDLSKWWSRLQRSGLGRSCLLRLSPKSALARSRHTRVASPGRIGHCHRTALPPIANHDRLLHAQCREPRNPQRPVYRGPFYNQWNFGFNLNWELDFWGRFRRAIESDVALLDASVEDYDAVLVTLLGDVATNYTQMRTLQERIQYATANVRLQRETLTITEARFRGGTTSELDVYQARSTLEQTEAQIPELEIALRQTINQLCILLGMPPEELEARLGPAPIPTAPVEVAIGIPANLLNRRPDVRRAERQAAAQIALIGVAEADYYPAISIDGTLGYAAANFKDLFKPSALNSNVGPSFQWNLLNYGRILNNVRFQDARFQELVFAYQQSVLAAAQDVENGLVTFLRAQRRTKLQASSVDDAQKAVTIVLAQYRAGAIDFTRVTQLEVTLVQEQDVLSQAEGEICTGLIQVYRALGGGWQIRLQDCNSPIQPTGATPTSKTEPVPAPKPDDQPQIPAPPQ